MAKVMKKFHFLFWTTLYFVFIRFNFWKSSKEAELLVTSMTAGMEDITLLQLKYQPDSEWRQMNLSLPMDGWSNWFALQFTARLLLGTRPRLRSAPKVPSPAPPNAVALNL